MTTLAIRVRAFVSSLAAVLAATTALACAGSHEHAEGALSADERNGDAGGGRLAHAGRGPGAAGGGGDASPEDDAPDAAADADGPAPDDAGGAHERPPSGGDAGVSVGQGTVDASVPPTTPVDAAVDAGDDAAALDAAVPGDAAADADAPDPAPADAAVPDAGPSDAGASDSGTTDPGPADAGGSGEPPVRLNPGDCQPGVYIEPDQLSAEWRTLAAAGVRSTRAIAPGEGVFYYEAATAVALDAFTIGVATAAHPLDLNAGSSAQSFGVDPSGQVYSGGGWVAGFGAGSRNFGFVVDYRAANPVVHVIAAPSGQPAIVRSETLSAISDPLFIYLSGIRRTTETHVTINPGNDTTNAPFAFDARAVLRAAGLGATADALVAGWGATQAKPWNAPPTVLTPAGVTVAAGTPVTLTASASDAEDGALDATLLWEVLSTGYGPERVQGTGASFSFVPGVLGIHPVRVTVVDSGGKRARAVVDVQASGALQQFSDVRMAADPQSGRGIVVSDDGLRVHWTANGKYAIRANQGLYGGFWYFEARRLIAPANQAPGLVIGGASLDPYPFNVTPPSCSLNTAGGLFQNLIYRAPPPDPALEYYGFAVDYRGRYPIVYVVLGGAVAHTLHLTDATVPIYPMLYGNPTGAGVDWDIAINFGGEPFAYDPAAALTAAGIDASALVPCWGAENAACP